MFERKRLDKTDKRMEMLKISERNTKSSRNIDDDRKEATVDK